MSDRPYSIRVTRRAEKDIKKLTPQLRAKLRDILLEVIAINPHQGKKLMGDLAGSYSHRLTYKDRIVYSIDTKQRIIYVERAATHYGD
jgi:mRNA interferase RelE/StbE